MRQTENSIGTIIYPDEICFAFNPTYIKISGCSAKSVALKISSATASYSLEYMLFNGTCLANISRALQMFFDTYKITECRSVSVDVSIIVGLSYTAFSFNTIAIWGNISPGETFNGSRTVRWFDKFPQKLSVFTGGEFQDVDVINDTYSVVSPWDYTFDYTFQPASNGTISFVHDSREDGVFLRWIDRHGMLQYWLFERGTKEIKNDKGGNELTMDYADREGNSFRNIKRQQYFFSEVTQKLCASNVSEEEYSILESILTSPVIDLYHASPIVGWEPVQISKGTVKRSTDILQDFEFEISLPNINAQSL